MRKKTAFYVIARGFCKAIFKVIFLYEVENGMSLPEDKPMIICSNHVSNIDPVIINATQNRLIHFMAKKELFKNKFFGKVISSLGAFPVNRGNDGGKALAKAEELLNDDNCVGIFIEGTRSKTGKLGRPHSGAIVMAHETNTPIIPCCITGKTGFVKPFTKTKITFGDPVTCEELGIKEGNMQEYREASKKMMEIIGTLREKQVADFNRKRKG